jgi:integrase
MAYKENRRWRAAVKHNGVRKTKFFDKRKDAEVWEKEMLASLKQSATLGNEASTPTPLTALTVKEWLDSYVESQNGCVSTKTYKEKALCRDMFLEHYQGEGRTVKKGGGRGSLTVLQITPLVAQQYFKSERKFGRSGNAVNKDRKNLIAAWNWGVQYYGFPTENPFKRVKRQPESRSPRYIPSLEDFLAVIDIADGQDKTLLLTLFYSAGRKSEVFKLKTDDVDLRENRLRLWTRKRKNSDVEADYVPIPPEFKPALCEQMNRHPDVAHVFVSKRGQKPLVDHRRWLYRLCERAGVRAFGFHGIRHLAASVAIADGSVGLLDIQQLLRHKSATTTQRYIHRVTTVNRATSILASKILGTRRRDT